MIDNSPTRWERLPFLKLRFHSWANLKGEESKQEPEQQP